MDAGRKRRRRPYGPLLPFILPAFSFFVPCLQSMAPFFLSLLLFGLFFLLTRPTIMVLSPLAPLHLHCCTRSDSEEEEEEREEREAPIENDGAPPDRKASAVKGGGGKRAPRSKSRLLSFKGGIGGSNKRGLLCPSPPPSVTPPGDERRNASFCSPPLRSLPLHALLHIHVRIVEVCCSFDPTGKERDDGDDVRLRPPPRLHACCFREREGEKESDE